MIFTSKEQPLAKRFKRVRIVDTVILAHVGKRGRDLKLIAKAIGDRSHLTIKVTNCQIDIHYTDEKTQVYTPRRRALGQKRFGLRTQTRAKLLASVQ